MKRSEIEEKYKWDLQNYAKSEKDFFARMKQIEKRINFVKKFEGKLTIKKGDTLLANDAKIRELLDFTRDFSIEFSLLATYAHLRLSEDIALTSANEMCEYVSNVSTKYGVNASFVDVELSTLSDAELLRLSKKPEFKNDARFFELLIREKAHILSYKEEKLISSLGEFLGGFSDSYDKFEDADLKFLDIEDSHGKKYPFSQAKYSLYTESDDRTLRKNAFKEINGRHGAFINFLATNYINDVKETCAFAKIRGFKSALSRAIYSEEASEKVYNMLIKKVNENIPIMERYFEVKRKRLNLKDFAVYDSYAPIVASIKKSYTYEEAFEIIIKALKPLGKNYTALLERAKNERWVDVYKNDNKDSGAFSTGAYGANPVVLMNFEGDVNSVFTLAHELGHALHTYHSEKNQPYETSDYVIFVAEVASNVNEMFLLNYFLKNAKSSEEKLYFYDQFMRQVKASIFRQTMFSEFEEKVHALCEKGESLTAEKLCKIYEKLNKTYHGKACKQIPEMKYEWARIPHFYRSFYVYKYATGLMSAIEIVNNILNGKKENVKNYIDFLSAGSKTNPIDILKIAGVDLEKEKTFDDIFEYISNFLAGMEKIV